MPAVVSERRNTNVTTKKVSSAKLTTKPSVPISATATANAVQVPSARPVASQSMARPAPLLRTLPTIKASESTTIATPYHVGKKPGPGPSAV